MGAPTTTRSLLDNPVRVEWLTSSWCLPDMVDGWDPDWQTRDPKSYGYKHHTGRVIALGHDTILVIEDGTDMLVQERAATFHLLSGSDGTG